MRHVLGFLALHVGVVRPFCGGKRTSLTIVITIISIVGAMVLATWFQAHGILTLG